MSVMLIGRVVLFLISRAHVLIMTAMRKPPTVCGQASVMDSLCTLHNDVELAAAQ